jgi:hypothetical protein
MCFALQNKQASEPGFLIAQCKTCLALRAASDRFPDRYCGALRILGSDEQADLPQAGPLRGAEHQLQAYTRSA